MLSIFSGDPLPVAHVAADDKLTVWILKWLLGFSAQLVKMKEVKFHDGKRVYIKFWSMSVMFNTLASESEF